MISRCRPPLGADSRLGEVLLFFFVFFAFGKCLFSCGRCQGSVVRMRQLSPCRTRRPWRTLLWRQWLTGAPVPGSVKSHPTLPCDSSTAPGPRVSWCRRSSHPRCADGPRGGKSLPLSVTGPQLRAATPVSSFLTTQQQKKYNAVKYFLTLTPTYDLTEHLNVLIVCFTSLRFLCMRWNEICNILPNTGPRWTHLSVNWSQSKNSSVKISGKRKQKKDFESCLCLYWIKKNSAKFVGQQTLNHLQLRQWLHYKCRDSFTCCELIMLIVPLWRASEKGNYCTINVIPTCNFLKYVLKVIKPQTVTTHSNMTHKITVAWALLWKRLSPSGVTPDEDVSPVMEATTKW